SGQSSAPSGCAQKGTVRLRDDKARSIEAGTKQQNRRGACVGYKDRLGRRTRSLSRVGKYQLAGRKGDLRGQIPRCPHQQGTEKQVPPNSFQVHIRGSVWHSAFLLHSLAGSGEPTGRQGRSVARLPLTGNGDRLNFL